MLAYNISDQQNFYSTMFFAMNSILFPNLAKCGIYIEVREMDKLNDLVLKIKGLVRS